MFRSSELASSYNPADPTSSADNGRVAPRPKDKASGRSTIKRKLARAAATAASLLAVGLGVAYFLAARRPPVLEPWHRLELGQEFTAARAGEVKSFDDYLALEERLFAELARELAAVESNFRKVSRYAADSPTNPERFPVNWNRSYRLAPTAEASSAGGALMLHGLTDSPYSTRAVASLLGDVGFDVVGLRTPGHGTIPAGIAASTLEDWRAAMAIAVREVVERTDLESPFILVGYSNGAAMALDYTLAALDDPDLRVPDRLVFLSPALAVSGTAPLAIWKARLSLLPGLGHLRWHSVVPEVDPYKYNSFPVFAGAQIYRLTLSLEKGLTELEAAGRLAELPPVLVIQSAVDATVPPVASLTRLFSRLLDNDSELVLFDANRLTYIEQLLGPQVDELLALVSEDTRFTFTATLVTNAAANRPDLVAVTRRAGSTELLYEELGLSWPTGIYSLSHVAVPFPPEDPIYGIDTSAGPPFPFGLLELRGERGLLLIPQSLLARLRYNPFFPYLERRVLAFTQGRRWEEVLAAAQPGDAGL